MVPHKAHKNTIDTDEAMLLFYKLLLNPNYRRLSVLLGHCKFMSQAFKKTKYYNQP